MERVWPKSNANKKKKTGPSIYTIKNIKSLIVFLAQLLGILAALLLFALVVMAIVIGVACALGYIGSLFGMGKDYFSNGGKIILVMILIALFYIVGHFLTWVIMETYKSIKNAIAENKRRKEQELVDLLIGIHG